MPLGPVVVPGDVEALCFLESFMGIYSDIQNNQTLYFRGGAVIVHIKLFDMHQSSKQQPFNTLMKQDECSTARPQSNSSRTGGPITKDLASSTSQLN